MISPARLDFERAVLDVLERAKRLRWNVRATKRALRLRMKEEQAGGHGSRSLWYRAVRAVAGVGVRGLRDGMQTGLEFGGGK